MEKTRAKVWKVIMVYLMFLISVPSYGQFIEDDYFTNGGITYHILSKETGTAEVDKVNSTYFDDTFHRGQVNIPSSTYSNGINYTVVAIGSRGFYGSRVKEVYIPESVTSIGWEAFGLCEATIISLPSTLTILSEEAFIGAKIESIKLPNSLSVIQRDMFTRCENLKYVELPETLTEIQSAAFFGCINLKNISFPNSLRIIGDEAFTGTSLTEVVVPSSVRIGDNAFSECVSLIDVTLNTNSIGSGIFTGCTNLKNVTLPSSLLEIGQSCFVDCISLSNISIPASVRAVRSGAFFGCSSLTEITMSNSFNEIGNDSFSGCISLQKFTSYAIVPPFNENPCFEGVDTDQCVLYVPRESLSDYKTTLPWSIFKNILPIGEEMGVDDLLLEEEKTYKIFDLNGVKILETKDREAINSLPDNIYIINGKKEIIKK